jgi:hypothetical protein
MQPEPASVIISDPESPQFEAVPSPLFVTLDFAGPEMGSFKKITYNFPGIEDPNDKKVLPMEITNLADFAFMTFSEPTLTIDPNLIPASLVDS